MIARRVGLLVAMFALSLFGLSAQDLQPDPQSIISTILEDVAASSEEEIDLDALSVDLLFFVDNPINLNATSYEELSRLIFLTDFQIQSLLDYIESSGGMITLYELQLVMGFDYDDVFKILPFVSVSKVEKSTGKFPSFKYGKHDIIMRGRSNIETPVGYTSPPIDNLDATRYEGNKIGLYTRYSYKTRRGFQAGFVGEKDPGEAFFRGTNPYGFDHYSIHLQVSDVGMLKTAVAGDFNAEFGQGLTLWSGASFGKSSDPMNIRKRARGLSRSSSTNENLFLRGGGATVKLGAFEVSAFGSYKKIDANFSDSTIDGLDVITSLPTSGLHRTPSEIANKKTLNEMVVGGNANVSWRKIRAGVTVSMADLEGIHNSAPQLYKSFEPSLDNRVNIGADATYSLGNNLLFGEVAKTLGNGMGIIAGGLFRVHPLLNLSLLARSYQKDYSTYYTAAIAEGTGAANENGVLVGLSFKPIKYWQLVAYADYYRFPWLRFGVNSPSRGHDYSVEAKYSPSSSLTFSIRYRFKEKESNLSVDTFVVNNVVPYQKQALRFHLSYSPSKTITLKNRVELSMYSIDSSEPERGVVVYQDVSYKPSNFPLALTARFAVFDTESWNTRIYAYESDVLYYFSIPAYYSKGTRAYLLAKYEVSRNLELWFRIAQTFYANETSLGTGLDEIEGSTRTDIRLQLRLKL
ncbi:MAG TPA: hypothetical protein PL017_04325 [Tenuifilaceae bacterium]|nr:hypothetical protein [Tenuifilaceae bacterium]HPE17803.1 hypothetical protein [Tenuifilaceae bacterium]HPJ45300.1 hypothetical protein [Tenuifilaceae bacterium]HPQ33647.1 hypothetical protein [Tenuifilaceae bacterium]